MTSIRVPSEAELIELENWLNRVKPSDRPEAPAECDWHDPEWIDANNRRQRESQKWDTIRALLDLARIVKNSEKVPD